MFKHLWFAGLAVAAITPLWHMRTARSASVSTSQFVIRIGAPFGPPVIPVYAPVPVSRRFMHHRFMRPRSTRRRSSTSLRW